VNRITKEEQTGVPFTKEWFYETLESLAIDLNLRILKMLLSKYLVVIISF